jgi:hypothetical protein
LGEDATVKRRRIRCDAGNHVQGWAHDQTRGLGLGLIPMTVLYTVFAGCTGNSPLSRQTSIAA